MIRKGIALLFRNRDFGMLMGAQFAAQAGDGLVQAALAKLIVFGGQKGFDPENARSPDELLRIVLYVFVPYTIVSPFLGVVIDRWDRRRLLVVANGLRAVAVAVVALVGFGVVGDAALFLVLLLTLASTRVVLATKAAALPAALGEQSLVEGNAVSQFGGAMFQVAGAGIALVAAELVSARPIVLAGAAVYAIGVLFAAGVRRTGEVRARSTLGREIARVARSIADGVREVARTPKAGASISTYFWLRFLWSFAIVGLGFIARELLSDDDMGVLLLTGGAGAAGGALGFLLADVLSARVRTTARLVIAASVLAGGAVAVLGAIEASASIALLAFCLGLGFFLGKISLDTMVQEALGDDFRGRAFSLYDIAYNLAWVLAAGIMKLFWSESAQGLLLAAIGVVFLAGVGGLALWFRRAGLLAPASPTPAAR
ncbi:MAG TPA: MFS transporter [Actinomycetota bacterium]|nr:MFS transporter [Actinomycetota bacterium]